VPSKLREETVNEHEKAAKAAQQVEAITGFYIHLVVFILVLALLFVINWLATSETWWVQWPFLGWGIGLLAHGLIVFTSTPNVITKWQLRKIKQLKDRM
jgi:2TM domain